MIIPATFQALEQLTDYMMQLTTRLEPETSSQLVLAIHELCMNIVQHSYAGESGMIEVHGHWNGDRLELTLRDTGSHAYVRPDVIKPPNIFDFPESGWGIYIVHQVMDSVKYERFAGHNQWSLVKQFSR